MASCAAPPDKHFIFNVVNMSKGIKNLAGMDSSDPNYKKRCEEAKIMEKLAEAVSDTAPSNQSEKMQVSSIDDTNRGFGRNSEASAAFYVALWIEFSGR